MRGWLESTPALLKGTIMKHKNIVLGKAKRHGVNEKFLLRKVRENNTEAITELEMYSLIDRILADAFENEYQALYEGQQEDPEYALLFEFGVA